MQRTARTAVLPAFNARPRYRSTEKASLLSATSPVTVPADDQVSADRVLFEEKAPLGSLFVIHLGEFYRVLGGRTDRMETSLRLMGETLLKNRLEGSDTFAFHPEGFFQIRLNGNDRRAIRDRAEAMSDALGKRAVGDRFRSWRSIREADTANDDWTADDGKGAANHVDDDWALGHRDRLQAYALAAAN